MRNFNVRVNGKTFFVEIEEAFESTSNTASNNIAQSPVAVEQKVVPTGNVVKSEGGVPIVCPLPGLVLKLSVKEGENVKKNDKIMVLEAMKMEHEILAKADGAISFTVKEGDSVELGATIAYIK